MIKTKLLSAPVVSIAPLALAIVILAGIGPRASGAAGNRAQLPIVPVIVEYEYAEQYFMQWISDNPKYSMIEAIIGAGEIGRASCRERVCLLV